MKPISLARCLGMALPFCVSDPVAAQEVLEELHVTGSVIENSPAELAQSVTILRDETLDRVTSSNLGETLSSQLGISSSYFGAGSSRPIIRGLAGPRVRTMQDGIDSLDVSTVSGDHAVSIDPFVAEQIEIFRGPTTLLYGSGAVGGVINTVTNRIPEFAPEDGFEGGVELRGDTAADGRAGVLALDGGGSSFAWHFDAVTRETADYEIPGFAEHEHEGEHEHAHEAEHEGEHAPEAGHEADDEHVPSEASDPEHGEGILENSAFETDGAAFGASWLGDSGFFGASISTYASVYGVPGHTHVHAHEEAAAAGAMGGTVESAVGGPVAVAAENADAHHSERVRIDLEQTRLDLEGGWVGVTDRLEAINLRIGINDYEHVELEGDAVGTRFSNDAYEGRVEVMHAPWGAWNGAFGVQFSKREFAAFGDEAFVPPVDTTRYGVFLVEQLDAEHWQFSLGARVETQRHVPSGGVPDIDDTAMSLSFAALRPFGDGYTLALNAASAERMPVAEELYADGPHLATSSIEIGNPSLTSETSRHIDIGIRRTVGDLTWSVTGFATSYDDFIYLRGTGVEDPVEALPVFVFDQRGAEFRGFEAEVFTPIAQAGRGELDLRLFADYVEGELDTGDDLPRMPPLRYGARLQYHDERFVIGIEATRHDEQDNTAPFEEPTAGYTMVNADFNWTLTTGGGTELDVFVRGTNLADEEARKHTSFVKEIAPLPGRNFVFGVRTRF